MTGSNVTPLRKRDLKAHADWVVISPAIATKWLEVDTTNRSLSQALIEKYAADMRNGKWDEDNGETLKIASDGGVLDGQHRLWAIIEAEVTLRLLVVFDVDKDCFKTIDVGKMRTPGDVVGIAGVSYANVVAGAAAIAISIQAKKYGLDTGTPSRNTSRSDLIDYCVKNKDTLEQAARISGNHKASKFMSPSAAAALVYLFTQHSKAGQVVEQATAFFDQLGSGLYDNRFPAAKHPIHFLREKLIGNRAALSRMPTPMIVGLCIKAWNSYVSGRAIAGLGSLRLVAGEQFPKII